MKLTNLSRKAAAAGGALSLVLAGAGLTACSGGDGTPSSPAAAAPSASTTAAPVSSGDTVSASGTVESARVRELSFRTGGVITALKVKVGSKVAKGDLLGTVDSTVAQEALSAAYTAYVAAQKTYKEVKAGKNVTKDSGSTDTPNGGGQNQGQNQNQGSGNGSQGQTGSVETEEEAYAALVAAKNAYNKAQRDLDGTKVYAPFAGTITALSGTVDAEVASGATVFTLTDAADLRVSAEFSEADTTRLKKGQKASVTFDSLKKKVTGEIISVSPVPVGSSSASSGPGGGFQASSTSVVRYEVLVSLGEVPAETRVGAPVTVEVKAG